MKKVQKFLTSFMDDPFDTLFKLSWHSPFMHVENVNSQVQAKQSAHSERLVFTSSAWKSEKLIDYDW